MPDHLHGILVFNDSSDLALPGEKIKGIQPGSLGAVVGAFKSTTARLVNRLAQTPSAPFWQRNYYEHIVRDDAELSRLRQYIRDNPIRWDEDRSH